MLVEEALEKILSNYPDLSPHLRQTAQWHQCFVLPSLEDCVKMANGLSPEHLELLVHDPDRFKPMLLHYGALFMGYFTPVPVGDYMAGPNHTRFPRDVPARFSGALTPVTFLFVRKPGSRA